MSASWLRRLIGREPDEPREGPGLMKLDVFPWLLRNAFPGAKYRIFHEETGRLHLEAVVDGRVAPVEAYDSGRDEYGKLHGGRWRRVGDMCVCSESDLVALVRKIRGLPPEKIIVRVIE